MQRPRTFPFVAFLLAISVIPLAVWFIPAPSLGLFVFVFNNLMLALLSREITLRFYCGCSRFDRLITGIFLYFVSVLAVSLLCGVFGLFSFPAVSALSIATGGAALILRRSARKPPAVRGHAPRERLRMPLAAAITLIYALPILVVFAHQFGAVPLNWDCFHYHCTIAAVWLQSHSWWTKPPLLGAENFPFNGEIFFAWVMLPFRSDILLPAVQQIFYLFAVLLTAALAKRLSFNLWQTLLALLPLLAMAGVIDNAVNAKTDMVPLSLFLCALNYFLKLCDDRDPSALPLLLLALGFLSGSKYTGLMQSVCFLPLLFLHWKSLEPDSARMDFQRRALGGSLAALPLWLFWYARLDFGQLFSSIIYHYPFYFAQLWSAFTHPQHTAAQFLAFRTWLNLGVALLILAPCMAILAKRRIREKLFPQRFAPLIYLVAALWAIYFTLPFSVSIPSLRYIFPVFPLLGLLSAAALGNIPAVSKKLGIITCSMYVLSALPFFPYVLDKVPNAASPANILLAAAALGSLAVIRFFGGPRFYLAAATVILLPAMALIGPLLDRYSNVRMRQIEASWLYAPFVPAWSYLYRQSAPHGIGVFGSCLLYPLFGKEYKNAVAYQNPKITSAGWFDWILEHGLDYYLISSQEFDMNNWYYKHFAVIQRRRIRALGRCASKIRLLNSGTELYKMDRRCMKARLRHSKRARLEFGRRRLLPAR